ncbi:insulinase family protein [Bdellovibrio bacteriovorus]|uniref:M16 family metallopeptidase n=1 Tax=Bdellovibrio bacteriovorus TaxID=959 RepID=UPI0021CE4656|nr:pitrilysin family protein [Bdellovibrio bacteriovorus]UXR65164.1 insulinase family protein [Bdellovibrio bacteriovorus]
MRIFIAALTLPLVCSVLVACSSSSKNTVKPPTEGYVTRGNGSFKLQPYKEVTLENGLKVYFIHDATLPRVSLTMMIKTGSMQEGSGKPGLNALTSYLLEQGTQTRDALKLADEFGQLGSSLDISPSADATTVYADSLTTGSQALLDLFSDVTMNPAFKDAEIARIRSQMLAGLQKKVDNPSSFADEKMDHFVFGNHPYGRDTNGTTEGLKGISKQDVIKHYLTFFRPNNSMLAVVGNYDAAYENRVQEVFGKWTKRTIPEVKVEAPPVSDSLQVKLIVKKGLQQTQIRIGQVGINRADQDYLRLRLANETVGGSFASRLNQKVRDDLGLTYSIYSFFDVRKERGSYDIVTFTKNETAGKTLDEALKVLNDFVNTGATEAEVSAGRNQLIGQFPRAIETADRLAYNLLALDFYGIPVDYLTDFNKNVGAIKPKDANAAFKKAVNPAKFKVLVYGDEKIIPQFEKYKPVIERMK